MTLDGTLHPTEAAAREHAEDASGRKLDEFFASIPGMGAQMQYRLVCHALKNAAAFSEALKPLLAFDQEQADD